MEARTIAGRVAFNYWGLAACCSNRNCRPPIPQLRQSLRVSRNVLRRCLRDRWVATPHGRPQVKNTQELPYISGA